MKELIIILLISLPLLIMGQNNQISKIIGIYSDDLGGMFTTKLELKKDSTFNLNTIDPIFPYTFESFQNKGKFSVFEDEIVLNPNLEPRKISFEISSTQIPLHQDSIQIEINYVVNWYKDNIYFKTEDFNFELLTIFINSEKNYNNIAHHHIKRNCAFSRKVKNQIIIGQGNKILLEKVDVGRIGIFGYGFSEIMWLNINSQENKSHKLKIEHHIDEERMPRSKKVIIKKKKAFFYESNGKVEKSLIPLKKEKAAGNKR